MSRHRFRAPIALAIAPLAAIAQPVAAQLLQDAPTVVVPPEPPISDAQSAFDRSREVAVADRMLPEFSAQGTSVGPFDVFGGLALGGLFSSNVFADNDRKRSDVALVVRPELTIRTSAGPYQARLYGRGDIRRYSKFTSEDTEEGLVGLDGTVAIGALSRFSAGASYGSLIDPRFAADSPANAAKPLEYTSLNSFAAVTIEGGRTRVIVRGDLGRLRFRDTPARGGGTLFTRDRDRSRVDGIVRVERALSPAVSVYGAVTGNTIDYRLPIANVGSRDSSGYGVYLGSSFEVTAVLRGDVRVGYLRQNFDLSRFSSISGLGVLGTFAYSPTRLWTFIGRVESSVQDSGVPGTGGYLHRGGSLRADNELRRYIILGIEGGYFRDTYRGLPRRDSLPFADVGLTYLSKSHWNARLGYRYLARSCTCSVGVTDFDDHRVSATLTFQN